MFLSAYDWFVKAAEAHVPKPQGAEYPYWAFKSPENVDPSAGGRILVLRVPLDEAVFFSLYDWNKILCLSYMGKTEKEEKEFRQTLLEYGIRRESDLILTNFYPELKRRSWTAGTGSSPMTRPSVKPFLKTSPFPVSRPGCGA